MVAPLPIQKYGLRKYEKFPVVIVQCVRGARLLALGLGVEVDLRRVEGDDVAVGIGHGRGSDGDVGGLAGSKA